MLRYRSVRKVASAKHWAVVGVAIGALLLVPHLASAQSKTLEGQIVFGGAGGSPGDLFRNDLIPTFEKMTGVKVVYVTGTLQQHYARIAAQPDNPEFDVVWSSYDTHEPGKKIGVFAELDEESVPNLKDIYPQFRNDPIGVKSSNSAVGIMYNPEAFAEAGIPKPESWKDLWDPRLKGKVGVWTISSTYGSVMIPFLGQLYGSGIGDYDTGFKKILEVIGDSTPLLEAPAALEPLFAQGTIWVTQNSDARALQAKNKGLPVEYIIPKEGALGIFNYFDVLKKAKNPDAARAFVNFLISPEVQEKFATKVLIGPTNSKVKLPPEVSAVLIDTPEEIASVWVPDYEKLVEDIPVLVKEFNTRIAR